MARKPIDGYWLKIGSRSKEELSIKINTESKPKPPPLEKYYLKIGSNSAEELSMIVSKDSLPRPPKKIQPEISGASVQGRPIRRTNSSCNTDLLMPRTKPRKYQRSKTTEQCSIEVVKNENVDLMRPFIAIRDRARSDSNFTSSPELMYQPHGSGQSLSESIPSTSSEISENWPRSPITSSLHSKRLKEIENMPPITRSCSRDENNLTSNEDTIYENSRLAPTNSMKDLESHLYENNITGSSSLPESSGSSDNHYENIVAIRPIPRKRISLESNNEPINNISRDIPQNNTSINNSDIVRTFNSSTLESNEPVITSSNENRSRSIQNSTHHLELTASNPCDNNDQLTISRTSEDIRSSSEIVLLNNCSNNCNVNLNSQRSSVVSQNNSISEVYNNNERRSSVNSSNSSQRDRRSINSSDICLRRLPEGNNDEDTGSVNDSISLNSNSFNDKHSISKSNRNKTVEQCKITVIKSSDSKKISKQVRSPKINSAEQCSIIVVPEDSASCSNADKTNPQMIGPRNKVKETCFISESKSSKNVNSLEQVDSKRNICNKDITASLTLQQESTEESLVVRKNVCEENIDVHKISKTELTPEINMFNSRIENNRKTHLESVNLYSEAAGTSTNSTSKELNGSMQDQKHLKFKKGQCKTIENCSIIVAKHSCESSLHQSNPNLSHQDGKTSQEECSILVAYHTPSPLDCNTEASKETKKQQKKRNRSQIVEECSILVTKNAGDSTTRNEANTSAILENSSVGYSLGHASGEEIDQCFNSSQNENSSSKCEINTNRIYPNLDSIEECVLEPLRNDQIAESSNLGENCLITVAADVHRPIERDLTIQNLTEINSDNQDGEQHYENNLTTRQREDSEGADSRSESDQLTSPTENSKLASLAGNESLATEASANNVDGMQPAISVSATVILRQRSQSTSSQESIDDETQEDISTDESREDPPGQEAEPCTEESSNIPPTSPRRLRWYVVQVHENNNEGIPTIESPPPYDAIFRDEHSSHRPFQPPTYDEACRTSQRGSYN